MSRTAVYALYNGERETKKSARLYHEQNKTSNAHLSSRHHRPPPRASHVTKSLASATFGSHNMLAVLVLPGPRLTLTLSHSLVSPSPTFVFTHSANLLPSFLLCLNLLPLLNRLGMPLGDLRSVFALPFHLAIPHLGLGYCS